MSDFESLRNHFLIAMPAMADPRFAQTVTLVCEHTDEGAMGLVVNQPMELSMKDMLEHVQFTTQVHELSMQPVMLGGPVDTERGFVLHGEPAGWENSMQVSDGLFVTSSRDIIHAVADADGPPQLMMLLGYAGWNAGQLDEEMKQNTWLSTPADRRILFETPIEQRWSRAAGLIGVDLSTMTAQAGHA